MKKQIATVPNDQPIISDTSLSLPTIATVPEPVVKGTKVKSNDGGYIWIV